MANRGVLPAPFGLVSPRKTPWFGIAFTTALSILLILTTSWSPGAPAPWSPSRT